MWGHESVKPSAYFRRALEYILAALSEPASYADRDAFNSRVFRDYGALSFCAALSIRPRPCDEE
jgi:hypothetical protein